MDSREVHAAAGLAVREVTVSFGGIKALEDVSVDVAGSEVVGVIGPNGAGKTTLFNVICGFVAPDSGTITWRDRSLKGWRMVSGLASFWIACTFGAWANVIFANALLSQGVRWYFAGAAGILVSSVWNYSMANLFTWTVHAIRRPG